MQRQRKRERDGGGGEELERGRNRFFMSRILNNELQWLSKSEFFKNETKSAHI